MNFFRVNQSDTRKKAVIYVFPGLDDINRLQFSFPSSRNLNRGTYRFIFGWGRRKKATRWFPLGHAYHVWGALFKVN